MFYTKKETQKYQIISAYRKIFWYTSQNGGELGYCQTKMLCLHVHEHNAFSTILKGLLENERVV